MTTQKFINDNKTKSLKKGDKVKMHNCGEADFYPNKEWVCKTDSFKSHSGADVVFLEDYSGYFIVEFLKKV